MQRSQYYIYIIVSFTLSSINCVFNSAVLRRYLQQNDDNYYKHI